MRGSSSLFRSSIAFVLVLCSLGALHGGFVVLFSTEPRAQTEPQTNGFQSTLMSMVLLVDLGAASARNADVVMFSSSPN
jgi:hypothetical protein